jgi:hypothetical protein
VETAAEKAVRSRIVNAKSVGWAIYAAGFAIWLFGYLSAGHAPLFDWKVATPWWISSLVPNLEAELRAWAHVREHDFRFMDAQYGVTWLAYSPSRPF